MRTRSFSSTRAQGRDNASAKEVATTSTPRPRYRRRINLPIPWRLLCREWLEMSREDAEQWWRALSTSQWSHAQELRGAVLGVEVLSPSVEDMRHFLERNWTPQRL